MPITFQWDNGKAQTNLARHEVSFEEASTVFADPLSSTIEDPRHSENEERYVILGQSVRGRLLVVVHTVRGDSLRVISARVATPTEREHYEEGR